MSTKSRHSYVPFYTSDWMAGTARMPRLVKSVYHDICLYTWDTARKVPDAEILLMLSDLEGQGEKIIDALVKSGKLNRDENGDVWSTRALAEAEKAFDLWKRKSSGGKKTGGRKEPMPGEAQDSSKTAGIDIDIDPDIDNRGGTPPLAGEPKIDRESSGEGKPAHPENTPEYLAAVDALIGAAPAAGKGGKPDEDEPEKPKRISAGACAEVFGAWNAAAKPLGLSVATKMTGSREGSIRARIEELGSEAITQALGMLGECRFLQGDNDRKWKADIDFFLRPNSIPRILEGKYRTAGGGASAWRDME